MDEHDNNMTAQKQGGWTPHDLAEMDHGSAFAEDVWVAVQNHAPREMTKLEKSQMSDAVTNAAVEFVMAWNRSRANPSTDQDVAGQQSHGGKQ